MRVLRFLARVFGWLLTPLLASAASFFGAIAGSVLTARLADPVTALILTLATAAIVAVVVTWGWLRWLRRSPETRHALGVGEHGMPEVLDAPESVPGEPSATPAAPGEAPSLPAADGTAPPTSAP